MADAVQTSIADAIVAQYEDQFGVAGNQFLSVCRVYVQQWTLEKINEASLFVTAVGQQSTRMDRGNHLQVDYRFLIGLGVKVQGLTNDELDPYATLLENLQDYSLKNTLAGRTELCLGATQQDWPNVDQLRTKSFFLGAFELVYRGFR